MQESKNISVFLGLAILLAGAEACAPATKPSDIEPTGLIRNYSSCSMPSDQGVGSLRASWKGLPIPIALDKDFYLSDGGGQAIAIKRAIDTWNAWGAVRGFSVFRIVDNGTGRYFPVFPDSAGCQQSLFTGSESDGTVVIWKVRSGGDGRNDRGTCTLMSVGTQGQTDWTVVDGHTTRSSILLNFVDYNFPGKPTLDIQSLALHELGHVIGLLHSCRSGEADGSSSPFCFGSNGAVTAPAKYVEAVMFPFLAGGQIRHTLMQNDYDRVNCLY